MITILQTALLAATIHAAPSSPADGWLAFTGCWRADDAPSGAMLCVVPDGDNALLLEVQNGTVNNETRIVTDGRPRAVTEEGCTGTETASWSGDGTRVYLSRDMKCGENLGRKASGVFAFVSRTEWIGVHAVTVGGQGGAYTTRYSPVPVDAVPADIAERIGQKRAAIETARYRASADMSVADVQEALGAVEPRAVEALLLAREQSFHVDGATLAKLADNSVPSYIIDALVAVSYPQLFEVRARPVADTPRADSVFAYRDRTCDRYSYSPWAWSYDGCSRYAYGYGYGYGYSRFGTWGYNAPWDYYSQPVIIVRDGPPASTAKATRRGYTRTRSDSPGTGTSTTTSASRPNTSSSGSSSANSGSNSSGSSSSTGRTAKPRNN